MQQAMGGRAEGTGSYSRDDRHKAPETAIPVRVAICEEVVLKEMIEFGAPGGRVEKRRGEQGKSRPALQNSRGGGVCVLMGSARIWDPLFGWSGLGVRE